MSSSSASPLSPMGQAALQYARCGWPVFPCRERDGSYINQKKETVILKAKQPYVGNGLKDATRDEEVIKGWWKRWPEAMIGVPAGVTGCFVTDFDPRTDTEYDAESGEVLSSKTWTLDELKGVLADFLGGVPLPVTPTVVTPSGGEHHYFRQPDKDPIRNRGVLPRHIDTRGHGGYTIVPPSRCVQSAYGATGEYRWLRERGDWRDQAAFNAAPEELVTVLRAPKRREPRRQEESGSAPRGAGTRPSPATVSADVDGDLRKYALSALDGELRAIRSAGTGQRNNQLNESAFKVATLVAAGVLDEAMALGSVRAAARDNAGQDDDHQLEATINSGWTAGMEQPRDLGEIAAASRSRRERAKSPPRSSRASAPRTPDPADDGKPSSQTGGKGGHSRQDGVWGPKETRECAFLPQTDLGNLERFLRRHGRDFLYVEAWGWLAWDGQRWNRDMAVPLLGRAIQDTMRAIQEEAELIAASGVPFPPEGGFPDDIAPEDRDDDDDMFARSKGEENRRKHKTMLWYRQRHLARLNRNEGERFDAIVQIKSNGDIVLLSAKIAAWGRTSEASAHIRCIEGMAQARLAARTDDFDTDPLLLNVGNGTLCFARPEGGKAAFVELRPHAREDRITKIAGCDYIADAGCPKFDAFLEEVQPDPEMRNFLDVWGGYNAIGLADAQKMAIFYGQGSNGKGVWINTTAFIYGDYAWAAAIETFIDQGKYRKGSDASPDLAALAGRRMVYANEPEEGSKFSDGLIKSMTSDEPISVRELLKPPFQLLVTFTNTVSANHKPKIGTDHGIQRRVQIIPWDVIIPNERADPLLKSKLKAEASGILNRLVKGALQYLDSGLPTPEAVKEATQTYLEENDILGMFAGLCVVKRDGETVGATPLHQVFAGWMAWAGQLPASGKAWSMKYLNAQMQKKGFKIAKSSTMKWQDIALQYEASDFTTDDGKVVQRPLPAPRYPADGGDHPAEDDDDGLPPVPL